MTYSGVFAFVIGACQSVVEYHQIYVPLNLHD